MDTSSTYMEMQLFASTHDIKIFKNVFHIYNIPVDNKNQLEEQSYPIAAFGSREVIDTLWQFLRRVGSSLIKGLSCAQLCETEEELRVEDCLRKQGLL